MHRQAEVLEPVFRHLFGMDWSAICALTFDQWERYESFAQTWLKNNRMKIG